jgi:hypothetical protein
MKIFSILEGINENIKNTILNLIYCIQLAKTNFDNLFNGKSTDGWILVTIPVATVAPEKEDVFESKRSIFIKKEKLPFSLIVNG